MRAFFFPLMALILRVIPARAARGFIRKLNARADKPTDLAVRQTHDLQLYVDVSVICQADAKTGIQRVVKSVLLELIKSPPAGYRICPVYATRRHAYRHTSLAFMSSLHFVSEENDLPVQPNTGDIFLGLDLSAHLLPKHQSQLLGWKYRGVKLHFLVYDLLPIQNPQWFNPSTSRHFRRWLEVLVRYTDSVVCISQDVKARAEAILLGQYKFQPGEVPIRTMVMGAELKVEHFNTGLAADPGQIFEKLQTSRSVLMVGTLEPRKGHEQVLAAFELLWNQPNPPVLVIVGKLGWKTQALRDLLRSHPQAGKNLHWLEGVNDELLTHLYAQTWGVLAASEAEGFGLPVIEASVFNKPVLARDLPVFREIDLPNITYFCADSAIGLADAISIWMRQAKTSNLTSEQKDAYSWQTATRQLLQNILARQDINLPTDGPLPASGSKEPATAVACSKLSAAH